MKTHYRILVAYDGTAYHGWQIQSVDRSVEGDLTQAAVRILDCSPDDVKIQGASRTDAGVHALGQVAHIAYDLDTKRSTWDFVRGLNALTDDDICVVYCEPAPEGFHARHSARGKIYRYKVWNHRFAHPISGGQHWRINGPLDIDAMRDAAQRLVGEHDFEAFRAVDCSANTTVRMLRRVEVFKDGPQLTIEVEGTAFLKYMVRIISGTLLDIGAGRLEPAVIDEMLRTGDRGRGGITAPAQGLTLVEIFYPDYPWPGGTPRLGGPWQPT